MVDTKDTNDNNTNVGEEKHGFAVHNIYTKDVSFESPNTPQIFSLPWEPRVDFDLQMNSQRLDDDLWEVVLDVTAKVSIKVDDENIDVELTPEGDKIIAAFLVEVKQAGVFSIVGLPDASRDKLLSTAIPSILFPYVRELVSNLVIKGGFQQLILPPMNFDAMYQKHLMDQKNKADEENTSAVEGTSDSDKTVTQN